MKRISIIVMAIVFTLMAIGYVESKPMEAAAPATGRALVKKLPAGVEGVELTSNAVRLKSGFKFVRKSNNTVAVARMSGGGLGVSGTFSCGCAGGDCSATTSGGTLFCTAGKGCKGPCQLTTTTGLGIKQAVFAY